MRYWRKLNKFIQHWRQICLVPTNSHFQHLNKSSRLSLCVFKYRSHLEFEMRYCKKPNKSMCVLNTFLQFPPILTSNLNKNFSRWVEKLWSCSSHLELGSWVSEENGVWLLFSYSHFNLKHKLWLEIHIPFYILIYNLYVSISVDHKICMQSKCNNFMFTQQLCSVRPFA